MTTTPARDGPLSFFLPTGSSNCLRCERKERTNARQESTEESQPYGGYPHEEKGARQDGEKEGKVAMYEYTARLKRGNTDY